MNRLLIKNGTVVRPQGCEPLDILAEDGVIVKIGKKLDAEGAEILDAAGLHVFPGLVDMHCHLREPGFEGKEEIRTGTAAAAKGGFTSVCCMPNTAPVNDNSSVTSFIKMRAEDAGFAKVYPIGAVSKGLMGKELAEMDQMRRFGAVAFSDDGCPVSSGVLMKNAMQYAAGMGMVVISHCEDLDLVDDGAMNEGLTASILGLRGNPTVAENAMIAREILLAEYLGVPVHIAHVSNGAGIQLIREAKARGVKVTCETCPHYFSLNDEACMGYNTLAKVNPPLRSEADRLAVIEGLLDGTIDAIATDHAPHGADAKNCEFDRAANGLIGFETAFALAVTHLVKPGQLTLERLCELMSANPARILSLPAGRLEAGAACDLTLADLEERWVFTEAEIESKSKNTPFLGAELTGRVRHTVAGGRILVRDAKVQKKEEA